MNLKQAKQLHNRDEVQIRTPDGKDWEQGYVLGDPRKIEGRIIVPVYNPQNGYREVDHSDLRLMHGNM